MLSRKTPDEVLLSAIGGSLCTEDLCAGYYNGRCRAVANMTNTATFDTIKRILSTRASVIHFIGIGGVSMYALAAFALERGCTVTGSDRSIGERTKALEAKGAKIYHGHDSSHVSGASLVVYSSAIGERNPEMRGANARNIPTVSRAQFMGALMLDYKNRIGICGTHGKSTTTAMIDCIFSSAMTRPTTISGAPLASGESYRFGSTESFIYEACEYRDSFLSFSPTIALALNLELDHTDYFSGIEALKASFIKALSSARDIAIVNLDDGYLSEIIPSIKCKVVTFGQHERANWRYQITAFLDKGAEITLYHHGVKIRKIRVNLPGVHNLQNAAAAAVVALEYGLPCDLVCAAIEDFKGVPRRLELVGEHLGRPVYYDYAHHPTEITAGINTLKMLTGGLVTVVFKPHTYTRTASLWNELSCALSLADHIVLTDIFPAREEPIPGITSRRLCEDIGERAMFSYDSDVVSYVDNYTQGAIVVMGAGDLENVKNQLICK